MFSTSINNSRLSASSHSPVCSDISSIDSSNHFQRINSFPIRLLRHLIIKRARNLHIDNHIL